MDTTEKVEETLMDSLESVGGIEVAKEEGGEGGESSFQAADSEENVGKRDEMEEGDISIPVGLSPGEESMDKGVLSPLTGSYLLIVLAEPHSEEDRDVIIKRLNQGLRSWDVDSTHVDLSCELLNLANAAPEGDEARNGEKLVQWASENLVVEVLIHCQVNTLQQCMKNLLSSFTKHRHIIHAGYTFEGSGSWILQDGTFSFVDFVELWEEPEVHRILGAYKGDISVSVHCAEENGWTDDRFKRESFTKLCQVRMNPEDKLTGHSSGIISFMEYISKKIVQAPIKEILEASEIVGNIRFSHPTLYVFPGGQGDAALFGVNGFNMLIDGGFSRRACFWDFTRHLDRLDAVLLTRVNNNAVCGLESMLERKRMNQVYPQIGHFFGNVMERKHPEMEKESSSSGQLLVSLTETGQRMLDNLRNINLKPHHCFREHTIEPVNLYHKVGHGKLDMYVLNPAKDSREVREFLSKWNTDCKSFVQAKMSVKVETNKEVNYPVLNLVSICALLVWQPDSSKEPITRILFPGSTPQQKIFEALNKLKHLEFLKYPVCSAKTIAASHKSRIKSERVISEAKSQLSSSASRTVLSSSVTATSGNGSGGGDVEGKVGSGTVHRVPSESRVASSRYSYSGVRSKISSSSHRSDSTSAIQTATGETTSEQKIVSTTSQAEKERKGRERSREKKRVISTTGSVTRGEKDNKTIESEVKRSSSRRTDSGLSKTTSTAKVSSSGGETPKSKISSRTVSSRIDSGKKPPSGVTSPPVKKESSGENGNTTPTPKEKKAIPSSKYGIGVSRTTVSKSSAAVSSTTSSPPPTPPKSAKEATNRKVITSSSSSSTVTTARKSLVDTAKSKSSSRISSSSSSSAAATGNSSSVSSSLAKSTSSSNPSNTSTVKSTIQRPSTASKKSSSAGGNEPVAVKRPGGVSKVAAASAAAAVAVIGSGIAAAIGKREDGDEKMDETNGTSSHEEIKEVNIEIGSVETDISHEGEEMFDQNGLHLSIPVTESSSELSSLDHISVNEDIEESRNGETLSEDLITQVSRDKYNGSGGGVGNEVQSETHTITEPGLGGEGYDEEDEYLIVEKDESAGGEDIDSHLLYGDSSHLKFEKEDEDNDEEHSKEKDVMEEKEVTDSFAGQIETEDSELTAKSLDDVRGQEEEIEIPEPEKSRKDEVDSEFVSRVGIEQQEQLFTTDDAKIAEPEKGEMDEKRMSVERDSSATSIQTDEGQTDEEQLKTGANERLGKQQEENEQKEQEEKTMGESKSSLQEIEDQLISKETHQLPGMDQDEAHEEIIEENIKAETIQKIESQMGKENQLQQNERETLEGDASPIPSEQEVSAEEISDTRNKPLEQEIEVESQMKDKANIASEIDKVMVEDEEGENKVEERDANQRKSSKEDIEQIEKDVSDLGSKTSVEAETTKELILTESPVAFEKEINELNAKSEQTESDQNETESQINLEINTQLNSEKDNEELKETLEREIIQEEQKTRSKRSISEGDEKELTKLKEKVPSKESIVDEEKIDKDQLEEGKGIFEEQKSEKKEGKEILLPEIQESSNDPEVVSDQNESKIVSQTEKESKVDLKEQTETQSKEMDSQEEISEILKVENITTIEDIPELKSEKKVEEWTESLWVEREICEGIHELEKVTKESLETISDANKGLTVNIVNRRESDAASIEADLTETARILEGSESDKISESNKEQIDISGSVKSQESQKGHEETDTPPGSPTDKISLKDFKEIISDEQKENEDASSESKPRSKRSITDQVEQVIEKIEDNVEDEASHIEIDTGLLIPSKDEKDTKLRIDEADKSPVEVEREITTSLLTLSQVEDKAKSSDVLEYEDRDIPEGKVSKSSVEETHEDVVIKANTPEVMDETVSKHEEGQEKETEKEKIYSQDKSEVFKVDREISSPVKGETDDIGSIPSHIPALEEEEIKDVISEEALGKIDNGTVTIVSKDDKSLVPHISDTEEEEIKVKSSFPHEVSSESLVQIEQKEIKSNISEHSEDKEKLSVKDVIETDASSNKSSGQASPIPEIEIEDESSDEKTLRKTSKEQSLSEIKSKVSDEIIQETDSPSQGEQQVVSEKEVIKSSISDAALSQTHKDVIQSSSHSVIKEKEKSLLEEKENDDQEKVTSLSKSPSQSEALTLGEKEEKIDLTKLVGEIDTSGQDDMPEQILKDNLISEQSNMYSKDELSQSPEPISKQILNSASLIGQASTLKEEPQFIKDQIDDDKDLAEETNLEMKSEVNGKDERQYLSEKSAEETISSPVPADESKSPISNERKSSVASVGSKSPTSLDIKESASPSLSIESRSPIPTEERKSSIASLESKSPISILESITAIGNSEDVLATTPKTDVRDSLIHSTQDNTELSSFPINEEQITSELLTQEVKTDIDETSSGSPQPKIFQDVEQITNSNIELKPLADQNDIEEPVVASVAASLSTVQTESKQSDAHAEIIGSSSLSSHEIVQSSSSPEPELKEQTTSSSTKIIPATTTTKDKSDKVLITDEDEMGQETTTKQKEIKEKPVTVDESDVIKLDSQKEVEGENTQVEGGSKETENEVPDQIDIIQKDISLRLEEETDLDSIKGGFDLGANNTSSKSIDEPPTHSFESFGKETSPDSIRTEELDLVLEEHRRRLSAANEPQGGFSLQDGSASSYFEQEEEHNMILNLEAGKIQGGEIETSRESQFGSVNDDDQPTDEAKEELIPTEDEAQTPVVQLGQQFGEELQQIVSSSVSGDKNIRGETAASSGGEQDLKIQNLQRKPSEDRKVVYYEDQYDENVEVMPKSPVEKLTLTSLDNKTDNKKEIGNVHTKQTVFPESQSKPPVNLVKEEEGKTGSVGKESIGESRSAGGRPYPTPIPSAIPSKLPRASKEVIRTPDEVADLPMHEEVEPGTYDTDHYEFMQAVHPRQRLPKEEEDQEKHENADGEDGGNETNDPQQEYESVTQQTDKLLPGGTAATTEDEYFPKKSEEMTVTTTNTSLTAPVTQSQTTITTVTTSSITHTTKDEESPAPDVGSGSVGGSGAEVKVEIEKENPLDTKQKQDQPEKVDSNINAGQMFGLSSTTFSLPQGIIEKIDAALSPVAESLLGKSVEKSLELEIEKEEKVPQSKESEQKIKQTELEESQAGESIRTDQVESDKYSTTQEQEQTTRIQVDDQDDDDDDVVVDEQSTHSTTKVVIVETRSGSKSPDDDQKPKQTDEQMDTEPDDYDDNKDNMDGDQNQNGEDKNLPKLEIKKESESLPEMISSIKKTADITCVVITPSTPPVQQSLGDSTLTAFPILNVQKIEETIEAPLSPKDEKADKEKTISNSDEDKSTAGASSFQVGSTLVTLEDILDKESSKEEITKEEMTGKLRSQNETNILIESGSTQAEETFIISSAEKETLIVEEKREKLFFLPQDDDEDVEDADEDETGSEVKKENERKRSECENGLGAIEAGLLNAENTLSAPVVHQSPESIATIPSDRSSSSREISPERITTTCADVESQVPTPSKEKEESKESLNPTFGKQDEMDMTLKSSEIEQQGSPGIAQDKEEAQIADDHKTVESGLSKFEMTQADLAKTKGDMEMELGQIPKEQSSKSFGKAEEEFFPLKKVEGVTRITSDKQNDDPISETLIETAHSTVSRVLESATETLEVAETTVEQVENSIQDKLESLAKEQDSGNEDEKEDEPKEVVEKLFIKERIKRSAEFIEQTQTSSSSILSKDVLQETVCDSMKLICPKDPCKDHDSEDEDLPEVVEEPCTRTVVPPRYPFKDDDGNDDASRREKSFEEIDSSVKDSMKTVIHKSVKESVSDSTRELSESFMKEEIVMAERDVMADLEDSMIMSTIVEKKVVSENKKESSSQKEETLAFSSVSTVQITDSQTARPDSIKSPLDQIKSPTQDPEERFSSQEPNSSTMEFSVVAQMEAEKPEQEIKKKRKQLTDYIGTIREAKAVFDNLLTIAKSGAALSTNVDECKVNAQEAIRRHLEASEDMYIYKPAKKDSEFDVPDSPEDEVQQGITVYESLEQMAKAGSELFGDLLEKIERQIEDQTKREEENKVETEEESERRLSAEIAVNSALQHLHETFKTMQILGGSPKRSSYHAAHCQAHGGKKHIRPESGLALSSSSGQGGGGGGEEEEQSAASSSAIFSLGTSSTGAEAGESTLKSPDEDITERSEGETMRESIASFTSGVVSEDGDYVQGFSSFVKEGLEEISKFTIQESDSRVAQEVEQRKLSETEEKTIEACSTSENHTINKSQKQESQQEFSSLSSEHSSSLQSADFGSSSFGIVRKVSSGEEVKEEIIQQTKSMMEQQSSSLSSLSSSFIKKSEEKISQEMSKQEKEILVLSSVSSGSKNSTSDNNIENEFITGTSVSSFHAAASSNESLLADEERNESRRRMYYSNEGGGTNESGTFSKGHEDIPFPRGSSTTTTTTVSPGGSVTRTSITRRFSTSGDQEVLQQETKQQQNSSSSSSSSGVRRASEIIPSSTFFPSGGKAPVSFELIKDSSGFPRPQSDVGYQTKESGDEESLGAYQSGGDGDSTRTVTRRIFHHDDEEPNIVHEIESNSGDAEGGNVSSPEFSAETGQSGGFSNSGTTRIIRRIITQESGEQVVLESSADSNSGTIGSYQEFTTMPTESGGGFTTTRTVTRRIIQHGDEEPVVHESESSSGGAAGFSNFSTIESGPFTSRNTKVVRRIITHEGDNKESLSEQREASSGNGGGGVTTTTVITTSGQPLPPHFFPYHQDILEEENYSSGDFSDSQMSISTTGATVPTSHSQHYQNVETDDEVHNFDTVGDLDNGNFPSSTVVSTGDDGSITKTVTTVTPTGGDNGNGLTTTTQTSRVISSSTRTIVEDPLSGESSNIEIPTSVPTSSTTGPHSSGPVEDIIKEWGKPLGLPVVYSEGGAEGGSNGNDSAKGTATPSKRKTPGTTPAKSASSKKTTSSGRKSKGSPIYVDLAYVPHHGNSHYCDSEFFRLVRSRYYVFSGLEPSREVFDGLLEGKQQWEDKNLETTVIPTYDTDTLGYWVADSEKELAEAKIDLAPSASRCTINLQDHETSCAAYRLEF